MKIVFSDIDKTLMFDLHVAPETLALVEEIRRQVPFALITARSFDSVSRIPPIPHDHLIVENGCVIYEGEEIDQGWDARIRECMPLVEGLKQKLGYVLRPKTRMISIGMAQNGLTWADAERLQQELPPGLVLRTSSNERGDFLEIYPAIAGKATAIEYVRKKLGASIEETCCLGDDRVDLEMLAACGFPVTHEGAREPVVELVRERGGYVAPGDGHAAAAEMLRAVPRWLQS
jgi:hydroxymethylpyrimidine pyrophosphatase-like HAD family hydrolase